MADASALATIASIITAFGVAMLFYRIQRELEMRKRGERNWIPWADWLLVGATLTSLVLVLIPLVAVADGSSKWALLPPAAAAAACVLVVGYIPAILGHYRFVFGAKRQGRRDNPEPAERVAVIASVVLAPAVGALVFLLRSAS